jgi:hypothetical protein
MQRIAEAETVIELWVSSDCDEFQCVLIVDELSCLRFGWYVLPGLYICRH